MNIVFINTTQLWGGGEHWTLQAAVEFRRRGHETRVVAALGSPLLRECETAGLEVLSVAPRWWLRPWTIQKLRRRLVKHPPDLIVTNSGRDVRIANRIRPSHPECSLIFRRGLDRPVADHFFHRRAFRRVQFILANSLSTRRTMENSLPWFSREAMRVVYNPVPAEEFLSPSERDVRTELGIEREAFVVGVIARLTRQKGHETLLRAFTTVRSRLPEARLLIVGEGELREELERLVAHLELAGAVTFTGHASPVRPFYDACDVVAVPSLYEGFCFTAVEAQLAGKPVVATNTSSLPEVLRDGETGFLVPVGDADTLAGRLIDLCEDPELRERLGREGTRQARDRFEAKNIFDELECLFAELMPGRTESAEAGGAG